MTIDTSTLLAWVSTVLGLLSIALNIWQHLTYSARRDLFVGHCRSWMHSLWDISERVERSANRFAGTTRLDSNEVKAGFLDVQTSAGYLAKDIWAAADVLNGQSLPDGEVRD